MAVVDCIVCLMAGFVLGIFAAWCIVRQLEKEEQQENEEPQRWFVRYAYRRTHYGNYAPPTQWFHTYKIIESDDTGELAYSKLHLRLHDELLFPNSKDDVEIRIVDIHEI